MTRSELWAHYYQTAIVDLGLSEDQFWKMNPRKLQILMDRKREIRNHDHQYNEYLFGVLNSTVANFSMARGKEVYRPTDFMPSEWNKPTKQQSAEDMKSIMDAWVGVTNAKNVKVN